MGGRSAGLWLGGLWGLQAELGVGSTGKSVGNYLSTVLQMSHLQIRRVCTLEDWVQ